MAKTRHSVRRVQGPGIPARWELVRFAMVGAISSMAYSLIAAAVIRLSAAPPYLTSVFLFGLFIPTTFQAHKRYTFRAENLVRSAFVGYAALQTACFCLVSAMSTRFLTGTYGVDAALFFATVGIAAAASFLIGRLFIFRPAPEAAQRNGESGRRRR